LTYNRCLRRRYLNGSQVLYHENGQESIGWIVMRKICTEHCVQDAASQLINQGVYSSVVEHLWSSYELSCIGWISL